MVFTWDFPFQLLQIRFEARGTNTQRSTIHIWVDRNARIWWDHQLVAPPGYDCYCYFETGFHKKYYAPACSAKLPRFMDKGSGDKTQTGKRKIQVFPFEAAQLSLEYYNFKKYDAHIRCIVRYSLRLDGPLNMPIWVVRRMTQTMNISNVAHRDFAYLNYQRAFSIFYSIVLNVYLNKLNVVTGKVNPKKSWRISPAVLDAHTQRNGMRDCTGKFSKLFVSQFQDDIYLCVVYAYCVCFVC